MNRWLTVVFLVASVGGALSLYTAVSVGSGGLASVATNLKSLSVVLNNYYTALNTGRTLVNATLNDLGYYVDVTYAGLNKAYGASQMSLSGFLSTVQYFNQSLQTGEQMVNMQISTDLSQLTSTLQQAIDTIIQTYSSSLYTLSSSMNGVFNMDICVAKNVTQMINIPSSIGKLGSCLQQEVNTAKAITPIIVSTIKMFKNDLKALNAQLQICQPTSNSCIDQYFMNIYSEMSTIQSALSMVQQFISSAQQDASTRNRICSDLVTGDIQDAIQNIQSAVSSCSYPMY
ncbi:uncharacterized protein LOC6043347 [Culex quinquefasciatus]|uniref:uncharacterized protein LOC6043347 n=1 Tax=Culex quinquefasciatus TaxID=7176 RepID=UPI0018E32F4C|nr:uncharacterized protein LOC6043347 [Culex quinquefasciatus]